MIEYTPTTDQVRAVFVAAPGHHTHAGSRHEAFERWLASITAHAPTADGGREARLEYVIDAAVPVDEFPSWRFRYSRRIADALRAAGLVVEPQGEPSDAQVLDQVEKFAQSEGVMFAGGPRGAWLPVDVLLDIVGERAR